KNVLPSSNAFDAVPALSWAPCAKATISASTITVDIVVPPLNGGYSTPLKRPCEEQQRSIGPRELNAGRLPAVIARRRQGAGCLPRIGDSDDAVVPGLTDQSGLYDGSRGDRDGRRPIDVDAQRRIMNPDLRQRRVARPNRVLSRRRDHRRAGHEQHDEWNEEGDGGFHGPVLLKSSPARLL